MNKPQTRCRIQMIHANSISCSTVSIEAGTIILYFMPQIKVTDLVSCDAAYHCTQAKRGRCQLVGRLNDSLKAPQRLQFSSVQFNSRPRDDSK